MPGNQGANRNRRLWLSSERDPPDLEVSDRDFFRDHLDRNERTLFIGPAIFGRILAQWVVPISRRYNNFDGSFAGAATAFPGLEFFQKFYDQIDVGPSGSILLLSADERLLVRQPFVESNVGRDMSGSDIVKALKRASRRRRVQGFDGRGNEDQQLPAQRQLSAGPSRRQIDRRHPGAVAAPAASGISPRQE